MKLTKGNRHQMKVLMLGWELPPHNSGGLGVACQQLCQSLNKNGVDIDFILPFKSNESFTYMNVVSALPLDVKDIKKLGGAYDSFMYVKENGEIEWHDVISQQYAYEKSVENIARDIEFDIIHAHDWLTFRAGLRAKSVKNAPLILHVHSIEHDRAGGKLGNPLVHEIEYTSMMLADRIIAVSNHTKKLIVKEYGIPADKISVVHNSIDIESIPLLEGENSFKYLSEMKNKGFKVVTNIGRLTIQKGLNNLLLAAKEVIRFEPKTIFLIVGSGEQYYELIQMSADLGISKNIMFSGFLRGKQWRDAFAVSDLFLMPSVSEPFGLTPLEAAGYGTPSLISKQSGVCEVFKNCLKVDYWDINKMANDIVSVIKNPSLHNELSNNAYSEFLRLSWDSAAKQIKGHYKNHLESLAA